MAQKKDRTWPTDFSNDEILNDAKRTAHKLTKAGGHYAVDAREQVEKFATELIYIEGDLDRALEANKQASAKVEISQLREDIEHLQMAKAAFQKDDTMERAPLMSYHIDDLIRRKQARIAELKIGVFEE